MFGLNVVLVEPEIPQNTGSIGRLCLATNSNLHLVKPYGFELSDAQLKRAGLDYWKFLNVFEYENTDELLAKIGSSPKVFFTKKAGKTLYEHSFQSGSYLIFGKETAGLSEDLLSHFSSESVRIPLFDARVRSLNLANAVSVGVYEAIRQIELTHQPVIE